MRARKYRIGRGREHEAQGPQARARFIESIEIEHADFLSFPAGARAQVFDMGQSDAELLEASRRGERDAFGALIERYQGVVCAVSYSRTGDHALSEDVAQDTFIAAWHQLGQLREPGRLRA